MIDEDKFINISALICEPARARMLWNLLDGRAYTASELASVADISATSASNHLTKLLEADLVKAESQGRHRYFSFSKPEVAYVVESLANLASLDSAKQKNKPVEITGIKYCRTCYDHLAGFIGVSIADAFEQKKLVTRSGIDYAITSKGWNWLKDFDITKDDLTNKRRTIAKQCLDWSERRPHLAGQLGALILEQTLKRNWFRKVQFSRELLITARGRKEIWDLLGINS